MAVNDEVADAILALSIDLTRVEASIKNEIEALLFVLLQELVVKLEDSGVDENVPLTYKQKRLVSLIQSTTESIRSTYKAIAVLQTTRLLELSEVTSIGIAKAINAGAGKAAGTGVKTSGVWVYPDLIDTTGIPVTRLKTLVQSDILGAPAKAWWAKQSNDTILAFTREVRMGVAQSEPIPTIVRRIAGTRGPVRVVEVGGEKIKIRPPTGGVMDISRKNATTLVRTSVNDISNKTYMEVYKDNADLINGVQLLVTLDLRTSAICRSRSGGAWDLNTFEPLPQSRTKISYPGQPPYHQNCRSYLIPVLKSWEELIAENGQNKDGSVTRMPKLSKSTQSSMDGQVADDLNYEDWLRKQPESRQKKVLGPGRWELWDAGKLTMADLVKQDGNPLTIPQLRELIKNR